MAFRDIVKYIYPDEAGNATIKLEYKDRAHRYYAYPRLFSPDGTPLSEDLEHRKTWGKIIYPKGTTTLIGDTLEKNGLMTWPMGMALQELFGFYNFEGDDGTKRKGYMKERIVTADGTLVETGKILGTLWLQSKEGPYLATYNSEELLPMLISAQQNHNRKKKKGADIGSVVHDAIEHYVTLNPHHEEGALDTKVRPAFDIGEQYLWNIKDAEYEDEADRTQAFEDFAEDVACANKAFDAFVQWWDSTTPILHSAEDLLYSKKHNISGTYDGDLSIRAEHHPVFSELGQKMIRVTADWKTSKASKSKFANMPEGVNYTYFIQCALYEIQRREMGYEPADDLLVVSARKDGGFTLIYASEIGLTVGDCIDWAMSVITCYELMSKTIKGLWAHAEKETKTA